MQYYVLNKCAKMPVSVKARYRKIAVMRAEKPPKMISSRCGEIVEVWDCCHLGHKPRGNTAAERALRAAQALADKLNEGSKSHE